MKDRRKRLNQQIDLELADGVMETSMVTEEGSSRVISTATVHCDADDRRL
jgi:hypothetical protein